VCDLKHSKNGIIIIIIIITILSCVSTAFSLLFGNVNVPKTKHFRENEPYVLK
jgi:flagellar basal body-associated protein FliL